MYSQEMLPIEKELGPELTSLLGSASSIDAGSDVDVDANVDVDVDVDNAVVDEKVQLGPGIQLLPSPVGE
jgi:hypothetical protein